MKNIILVGFMGTGKSVVGRMLAERLKCPFVDLDAEIEKEAGRSIAQIFAEQGEAAFRRREAEKVREISKRQGIVVATGGGVMLDEANVRLLKRCGTLVCLTARPEVILERALSRGPSRPLLDAPSPKERVEELLKLRAPFYSKADLAIETSDRTVEEVVEEIMAKIVEGGNPK